MLVDSTDGSQDRCNGLLANYRMEVELPLRLPREIAMDT